MAKVRIDAETVTPCGWGVYINGEPVCARNPAPEGADVNSTNCPAIRAEDCCRTWAEHYQCPTMRAKGYYGGSRRK